MLHASARSSCDFEFWYQNVLWITISRCYSVEWHCSFCGFCLKQHISSEAWQKEMHKCCFTSDENLYHSYDIVWRAARIFTAFSRSLHFSCSMSSLCARCIFFNESHSLSYLSCIFSKERKNIFMFASVFIIILKYNKHTFAKVTVLLWL